MEVQVLIDGDEPRIEGNVMCRTRGEAVATVKSLFVSAVSPGLDMACSKEARPASATDVRAKATEHAAVLVIAEYASGEPMLADPNPRGQQSLGGRDGDIFTLARPLFERLLQGSLDLTLD